MCVWREVCLDGGVEKEEKCGGYCGGLEVRLRLEKIPEVASYN